MESESAETPLIVIVGETASGKSALAMDLAEKFNGEIIAADSWTVYKDFDIGTAKASKAERMKIPHHLLDIADPQAGFSAAEYKNLAQAAIENIARRGKIPILVGGTGLYIDCVLFDYSFLPQSTPEIRAKLNELSLDELIKRAEESELDTLGIDLRNKRRIIRLIESNGARASRNQLRPNTLVIGVQVPREELRGRVTARVDAMFANGLEREVEQLAETYGWDVEPMKGIGYREFKDFFADTQNLELTRERIISATMNLAKRQRTWFKRNKQINWVANRDDSVEIVATFLDNPQSHKNLVQ
jgi:tRNA dimethylallyltransferase